MTKVKLEEFDVLDLTAAEAKVLRTLKEHGPLSVSGLAREVVLPRSTVDDSLERLRKRRLVRRVSKGYASVWRLVRPENVEQELTEAAEALGGGQKHIMEDVAVRVSETSEVRVYRGVKNIPKIYRHLFLNSGAKRVYAMQTAASARSWFDHMPPAVTHEVNAFIKESNVIIEAVLPEDIKEAYRAFAEADPAFPESFGGRMQAIRLVPSEWLTGNIEFFLFKHTVVMNNWNEQTIMVVEDENIAAFLKSLYSFMHEAGKPFDQNAFVRSLPATH